MAREVSGLDRKVRSLEGGVKQLREKEKEIMKLKTEQTAHVSQQSVMEEEQEKKIKQLTSQLGQS